LMGGGMKAETGWSDAHLAGEPKNAAAGAEPEMVIDTPGGRYRAVFDEQTPVSALGPLVFFAQFLRAGGRFDALCADAPLEYRSANAPQVRDLLGTLLLGILAGHWRYAHLTALRFDEVAPGLLGLSRIVSEDSVRRGIKRLDQIGGRTWLQGHLQSSYEGFLSSLWVLDIDTTVKPLYGRQQGATLGYNPHKPGRPSHVYHTYWVASLRLCLDVEVRPGREHFAGYGLDGLWAQLQRLPRERWPHLIRGDCHYGYEACLVEAEQRQVGYLFKVRRTPRARALIDELERVFDLRWQPVGQGWEATESQLALSGWSRRRRVVVLRRRVREARGPRAQRRRARQELPLLTAAGVEVATCERLDYEYQVLVTNLPHGVETLVPLYRERGDAENPFDELKNQWGWAGFTTHAFTACQHTARLIALAYNWWSLYTRLLDPGQHHEALSSRPRLLGGVARQSEHAGQRRLSVRLLHAQAAELKAQIKRVVAFLQELIATAEQSDATARWQRILRRILLENYPTNGPDRRALPVPL
jgi:hypothetical protein